MRNYAGDYRFTGRRENGYSKWVRVAPKDYTNQYPVTWFGGEHDPQTEYRSQDAIEGILTSKVWSPMYPDSVRLPDGI